MNRKSVQSDKKFSSGFISLPVLVMIVLGVTLAVTAKSIYNKSHVLGQSTMLAQNAPPSDVAPPQGAPQQQQPSQQQPSQPQEQPQQNLPQQPAQNNPGPQPQQIQPVQQNPQMNPQNYQPTAQQQQQYQQYMQKSPEEQKQMQQQSNQQGNNNYGQNNQGPQPEKYNGGQQQLGKEQNQQGGQNPNEQNRPGNNPQQYQMTPQQQQQYQQYQQMNPQQQQQINQQMQQQWQQEAAKNGFQINGNIPAQYFQQQAQQNTQGKGPVNQSTFQALPSPKDFATINGEFKVKSADGTSVNINDGNTKIQLGSNNSNLSLNAIRPDGKRIEIDKKAFEAIVAAMKAETGSEVSQKGDAFTFKRGVVEADTKFPISFDVATKTFSVQTSNGEQEVKVLPDQAVQKLMENKVFSQLQANTNSTSAVTLTELDNKPVYQVQGTIQKKFLGFVPWSNSKTTYVSADNGEIVKTDASAFSKLLDIISF